MKNQSINVKTIKKNNLTIVLDLDYLNHEKSRILKALEYCIDDEDIAIANKKGKALSKYEYQGAVERLYNLAIGIIKDNNIWDYITYTKEGLFHKTSTVLLATTGIKNIMNGDYFSMHVLQLRLVPVSYRAKTDPFLSLKQNGSIFGSISGDGMTEYIELDWFPSSGKEEPIFDENNNMRKITVVRNKYLKLQDMKPGYTYKDKSGNEFLYLGLLNTDHRSFYTGEDSKIYKDKESYMNSTKRKETLAHRASYSTCYKYNGEFFYLKMTKKNEEIVKSSANIGELIQKFIDLYFWDWWNKFKHLSNPLKVVSEVEKVIDTDLGSGFYYAEHEDEEGEIDKDFFYVERAE